MFTFLFLKGHMASPDPSQLLTLTLSLSGKLFQHDLHRNSHCRTNTRQSLSQDLHLKHRQLGHQSRWTTGSARDDHPARKNLGRRGEDELCQPTETEMAALMLDFQVHPSKDLQYFISVLGGMRLHW